MQQTNTPKRKENWPMNAALALLMLALLMAGCAAPQKPMPPQPVRSVQIPPLPETSRPPQKPLICSPDCLTAWQAEQQHLLNLLMRHTPEPQLAQPTTTAPVKL